MGTRFTASLLLFVLLSYSSLLEAGPGDTTTVQTFTFGSALDSKFLFPDSTHRWGKILMYYTLKCNPGQSPACGEWDYLTYTYLFRHTGRWDSTQYSHANFTFNGTSPDSLMYMNQGAWSYIPYFEYSNQTVPVSVISVGDSILTDTMFNASKDARSQCLWTAGELAFSGLVAGSVTGLRIKFSSAGSLISKFTIRMKCSTLDSLTGNGYENNGFTEVFKRSSFVPTAGWQTIPFSYPFSWDGTSNVVIDFSFADNPEAGWNINAADSANPGVTITSKEKDAFLRFRDMDFLSVPASVFSDIDTAVTIAFWQYGDPVLQPQNNTVFEGIDSAGHRILNVHLPWSDGNIYWDAGNAGGYDRISKASGDPSQYKGKWNHWAFTKDAKKGRMKIFLNGQQWFFQPGKQTIIGMITQFKIGSDANGTDLFYDGLLDDFSIWNTALSDTAIRSIMYRDIDPSDPGYPHLIAYYKFNEGYGFLASDAAPGNHTATLTGYPEWQNYQGKNRFRNWQISPLRPSIKIEQGTYDPESLDSLLTVDTIALSPIMIVLFGDTVHPYIATDTLTEFPAYYNNYVFDPSGYPLDSALVPPDGMLHRKNHIYYGKPFEILERYELARYITPYGNNLSLGDGWTWVYDVTDYASLLKDSVHLSSGNWQELLDMKFRMIEGIPPRDVLGIHNIYTGGHGYDKAASHNLPEVNVKIEPNVKNARLKMRITGHGFGGNMNCSEFCPRTNKLFINGSLAYSHSVWRDDCGLNPLFPQGGTWLYDRAAWCPGAEVRTTDFELSQYLVPDDSIRIDYNLQGYTWNGQGSYPYYQIESQLITYGAPNFKIDAAMEEVISPNNNKLYSRFNPLCGNPVIAIRNNGTDTLKELDVVYGPYEILHPQIYHWSGKLSFQDTARITLPSIDWSDWTGGDKRFVFTASNPNGGTDEYMFNNSMTTPFDVPPTYENELVFNFKSNHLASYLSWTLQDAQGNILYQNGALETNTVYIDTFRLDKGCYNLSIMNSEGEGIAFWANMPPNGNGTAGYAKLFDIQGQVVKIFQPDFGRMISQNFTVGMTIEVPELNPSGTFNLYPNPSQGSFMLSAMVEKAQDIEVIIHDVMGNEVYRHSFCKVQHAVIPVNLVPCSKGLYLVTVLTGNGSMVKKMFVY